MKFMGTLIAVTDLGKSRKFYRDILGLTITTDHDPTVTFNGCIVLRKMDSWINCIQSKYVMFDNRASEMYFETEDFDDLILRLDTFGINYVHRPVMLEWGQRVVRFYDPDRHIIEVGEAIESVMRRFADMGMDAEQIAKRMKLNADFVKKCLGESTKGDNHAV